MRSAIWGNFIFVIIFSGSLLWKIVLKWRLILISKCITSLKSHFVLLLEGFYHLWNDKNDFPFCSRAVVLASVLLHLCCHVPQIPFIMAIWRWIKAFMPTQWPFPRCLFSPTEMLSPCGTGAMAATAPAIPVIRTIWTLQNWVLVALPQPTRPKPVTWTHLETTVITSLKIRNCLLSDRLNPFFRPLAAATI